MVGRIGGHASGLMMVGRIGGHASGEKRLLRLGVWEEGVSNWAFPV
jgi:hypothetical protein